MAHRAGYFFKPAYTQHQFAATQGLVAHAQRSQLGQAVDVAVLIGGRNRFQHFLVSVVLRGLRKARFAADIWISGHMGQT